MRLKENLVGVEAQVVLNLDGCGYVRAAIQVDGVEAEPPALLNCVDQVVEGHRMASILKHPPNFAAEVGERTKLADINGVAGGGERDVQAVVPQPPLFWFVWKRHQLQTLEVRNDGLPDVVRGGHLPVVFCLQYRRLLPQVWLYFLHVDLVYSEGFDVPKPFSSYDDLG